MEQRWLSQIMLVSEIVTSFFLFLCCVYMLSSLSVLSTCMNIHVPSNTSTSSMFQFMCWHISMSWCNTALYFLTLCYPVYLWPLVFDLLQIFQFLSIDMTKLFWLCSSDFFGKCFMCLDLCKSIWITNVFNGILNNLM